jgi:hypothetical protein
VIKRADKTGFVAMNLVEDKRFRMDLAGHGVKPHAHLEEFVGKKWRDAGPKHWYFFKE